MVDYENVYIHPFASERYQRRKFYQEKGSSIALELMQIYFNKLFDGEYNLKLPKEACSVLNKSNWECSGSRTELKTIKETLHEFVVGQSSFETHIIALPNLARSLNVEYKKTSQWSERRRIKEISKTDYILGDEMSKKLFCSLPTPVTACFDYQYGTVSAVYFMSEKVFYYLCFTQQHADAIQEVFRTEHQKILEILMCISKPMKDQAQQCQISYLMKCFIIGFSLGGKDVHPTLMEDIDVNFYIALYVLEKLLKMAEQKFHFMDVRWIN